MSLNPEVSSQASRVSWAINTAGALAGALSSRNDKQRASAYFSVCLLSGWHTWQYRLRLARGHTGGQWVCVCVCACYIPNTFFVLPSILWKKKKRTGTSTDLMSFPHLPVNRRSHETPADQRYRLITGAPCRITTGTIGAYLLVLLSPTPSSSSGTWYEEEKKTLQVSLRWLTFSAGPAGPHSWRTERGKEEKKKKRKNPHGVESRRVKCSARHGPVWRAGPCFFFCFF